MKYDNQICPGCGQPMLAGEDIVVCPECATPQHRACYDKLGSCVNGYLHASGYIWQPDSADAPAADGNFAQNENTAFNGEYRQQPAEGLFCPVCGTKNEPGAFVCQNCRSPMPVGMNPEIPFPFNTPFPRQNPYLRGTGLTDDDEIGGFKAADIAVYLKNFQRKFIPKFKRFSDGGIKASWNWAAFFLSPFYFFYRRMFKAGMAFFGIFVAISLVITPVLEKDSALYISVYEEIAQEMAESKSVMNADQQQRLYNAMIMTSKTLSKDPKFIACASAFVLAHIVSALFADYFCYSKTLRDIRLVRENTREEIPLRVVLYNAGGTSFLNFICSYFLFSITCRLLMSFAEKLIS